jgi:mRNA interferase MazF
MERFVKGDVVVVPFPFSNLTASKRRPALVVTQLDGNDLILCQITTRPRTDRYSISLSSTDFSIGSLPQESSIRPNRLFTADSNIIIRRAGKVAQEKIDEVIDKIVSIIRS